MEVRVSRPASETLTSPGQRLAEDLKRLAHDTQQRVNDSARAADKAVRDHPYETIGIALGLGVLIGVLARHYWPTSA